MILKNIDHSLTLINNFFVEERLEILLEWENPLSIINTFYGTREKNWKRKMRKNPFLLSGKQNRRGKLGVNLTTNISLFPWIEM